LYLVPIGLDVIYIQAKRWEGSVGRPEIQKFIGALAGQGAKKGVFITTSRYTPDAIEYHPKNDTKIVLIDGEQLAELMIDFNLAVSVSTTFEIKKIDNDYFGED
jgi:restriction system protein